MNTEISNDFIFRSQNLFRWSLFALLVGSVPQVHAGSRKPDSNEPKTHTLFMGADLSVEYNGSLYRVLNVDGGAFTIKVGSKEVRVLADWARVVTKVDRTLKMTDAFASVVRLSSERAYTPANDPNLKFQRAVVDAQILNAGSAAAESQANTGLKFGNLAPATGSVASGAPDANVSLPQDIAHGAPVADLEMFDAIDVRFEISSGLPVSNPYVVLLGQYREKEAKAGSVANWVYAQALPPLTPEMRKVHIERGGFPRGYELLELQVHLYDHGREIATDVAPKRVALTRQEAFTYALMEYVSSHKGATVPANPFMGKLSAEARSRLTGEQLGQSYYVKVSKDGVPLAAFQDNSLSRPVDAAVDPLIQNVRFYPALEKGKPVEGVAELKFEKLIL